MNWKVTKEPTVEPVSVTEAKANLKIQHNAEDGVIERAIEAARSYCEQELGLAIVDQEITLKLDGFPAGRVIDLPMTNLLEVTSFTYLDADGAPQVFADYTADTFSTPGRVVNNSAAWPKALDRAGAVTIVYRAGFNPHPLAGKKALPGAVRQAIMLLVTHWVENRSAVVVGSINSPLQFAVESCLMKHRVLGV